MRGISSKQVSLPKLIRQRQTGAQGELALRLGLSVSRLARIIEYLKDIGAPIVFDRSDNTYYYEKEHSIQIKVEVLNIPTKVHHGFRTKVHQI